MKVSFDSFHTFLVLAGDSASTHATIRGAYQKVYSLKDAGVKAPAIILAFGKDDGSLYVINPATGLIFRMDPTLVGELAF